MQANAGRWQAACSSSSANQAWSGSLPSLHVALLHKILDYLAPHDLVQLLRTSKAMAEEVMRHSAGRLTLTVKLHKGVKWAATRQMLQWAPPSSLKLVLSGLVGPSASQWSRLGGLFAVPCSLLPAPDSHQSKHMQQWPCILEVCLQDWVLPSLVPAGLVAVCPNMHTVHLHQCTVLCDSHVSSSSSSSSALHTLVLHAVDVPYRQEVRTGYGRYAQVTTSRHLEWWQSKVLRSSVPDVACLKVLDHDHQDSATGLWFSVLGRQLTELQLPECFGTTGLADWHLAKKLEHMPQLQKLVLQNTRVASAEDMKQLLSLPSVTHLELDSIRERQVQDFSNHPCKWQYLHLHLHDKWLSLETLAKLPLHSLIHPLKLGNQQSESITVRLPLSSQGDIPSQVTRLAQQLTNCAVQVLAASIAWAASEALFLDSTFAPARGLQVVPALMVIGPSFGPHLHVGLVNMTVDKPILIALGTVYGPSLRQLTLKQCTCEADMPPAWHAALSSLPALVKLDLRDCFDILMDNYKDTWLAKVVRPLVEAMAQQPEGRCIEVIGSSALSSTLTEYVAAEQGQAGVTITVAERALEESGPVYLCLRRV